jgi:methyl-accepting chemotaxis protein
LLVLAILLVASNLSAFRSFKTSLETITLIGSNRTSYAILYELGNLSSDDPQTVLAAKTRIGRLIDQAEQWSARAGRSIPDGEAGARIERNAEQRTLLWDGQIKPLLQRALAMPQGNELLAIRKRLDPLLQQNSNLGDEALSLREQGQSASLEWQQWLQLCFSLLFLALLLRVFWVSQQLVRRTTGLVRTVEHIRDGDLDQRASDDGHDELGVLAGEFNDMTERLRAMLERERGARAQLETLLGAIKDTTNSLSSASAEILAGTAQQATGMREQSSAVAETVTTVDEVLQTSEQAAERANEVSEAAQRAADASVTGRRSIEETIQSIRNVKDKSGSVTDEILRLSEHGQAIGEIIAAVTDIADQTNLLAVNASIEASRAGEHGRGFTVVAQEIKQLADQSKKSTAQVRRILGDIQRSTHSAVMAAEAGSRSVEDALGTVTEGGSAIGLLEETITDAARAATQIAASAAQQATGMAQIQQAMTHINDASAQNLAATRQTEQAAQDLNQLGTRLKELLATVER